MLSDELHRAYYPTRWSLVLRGLISLALGLFIILRPLASVAALALVIAIWALISGITQIVHAVELRRIVPHWWLVLIGGVISTGFGLAALYYYPALSLTFAVVWTSYWFLLTGFFAIYAGVQERKHGMPWAWTVAFGALGVLAGLYAIMVPPATLAVIMGFIAGVAIIGGVLQLIGAYYVNVARARLAAVAPVSAMP